MNSDVDVRGGREVGSWVAIISPRSFGFLVVGGRGLWLLGVRAGCLVRKERKKSRTGRKEGRKERTERKRKMQEKRRKKGRKERNKQKRRRKVEKKEKAEGGGRSCRTRGCGREVLRVRSLWHLRDADPGQRSPGNRSRRFVGESVGLLRGSFGVSFGMLWGFL